MSYFPWLAGILLSYCVLTQLVKRLYIRHETGEARCIPFTGLLEVILIDVVPGNRDLRHIVEQIRLAREGVEGTL
jgi:hypothetical protein